MNEAPQADSFFALTPDRVLDAVEGALDVARTGLRATGRSMALNSIENRVYEIEMADGSAVVSKFYRPGRWSPEQIHAEHAFIASLDRAEVPVVPPLPLVRSPHSTPTAPTLARSKDGILFAVFPKVRGRLIDELSDDRLKVLGRFLARLHAVGSREPADSPRLHLNIETYGDASLDTLDESGFVDTPMGDRYLQIADETLAMIEPVLRGASAHAIHGDCHLGNVLWQQDQPFFVDFDDMLIGPPVQDIWMIVRGDDEEAERQRKVLLDAYEEMKPFDRDSLRLVEPLRALRMIHYSAWIARRWSDPSFPRMFPQFGTDSWWQSEIEALYAVRERLET